MQAINKFWLNWLLAITGFTMLFGITMVFYFEPIHLLFSLIAYQSSDTGTIFSEETLRYTRLLYAITGASITGWMISIIYILQTGFKRGERSAWLALTASVLVWFSLDTSISAYIDYWGNVIFNLIFLIGFVIPLATTYRRFFASSE